MITLIILGIFSTLKAKIVGGVVGSILGIGFIKNWAKMVDKGAKWLKSFSGKMKVLFGRVEEISEDVDESINDDTGKISLDKKDEIIQDVKDVIESAEDVIDEFKPNK